MIRFNQAPNDYAMPVIIEIQENLLRERLGGAGFKDLTADTESIRRGLRQQRRVLGRLPGRPDAPRHHQWQRRLPGLLREQQLRIRQRQTDIAGSGSSSGLRDAGRVMPDR